MSLCPDIADNGQENVKALTLAKVEATDVLAKLVLAKVNECRGRCLAVRTSVRRSLFVGGMTSGILRRFYGCYKVSAIARFPSEESARPQKRPHDTILRKLRRNWAITFPRKGPTIEFKMLGHVNRERLKL